LIAIGVGSALAVAEAIGEGVSPDTRTALLAVTVAVSIEATGVMLHEMATGARPFLGDSGMAVAVAIMQEKPPRQSRSWSVR
jgi:serine/threonine protein kinase